MSDLIDTTEMYLRTILELEEDGVVPLRARIVEILNQAGPTVSQTIARMQRDGLVELGSDRSLQLTEQGRAQATAVLRRHRLAERLLVDVIGLDLELVHDEACRWEHVMSEHVERRVVELVPDATVSPFGNPVPGLADLGVDVTARDEIAGEIPLHAIRAGGTFRVTRLGEPVQSRPGMLGEMIAAGITCGAEVAVTPSPDGTYTVTGARGAMSLSDPHTRHLLVVPL